MNSIQKKLGAALAVISTVPAVAMADGFTMDTSTITAGVTTAATAVGVVGAAVVLVFLGVKAFKWLRSSL